MYGSSLPPVKVIFSRLDYLFESRTPVQGKSRLSNKEIRWENLDKLF